MTGASYRPQGPSDSSRPAEPRSGAFAPRVKAVLGPTNTGKTHLAMERLLGHGSGIIGFPLRLLARENYDRMVAEKGEARVGLITGEEKIVPPGARWFSCTVEAMPLDPINRMGDGDIPRPEFVAVDEIQLCADPDRGHVFTDRLLHARGLVETMFLGAETIRPLLHRLVPQAEVETRPRLSQLQHVGPVKLTKLPPRSAVVAFSAAEVYAIAELIRRRRGGCAVVMGRLSPRTRNAQVALYQDKEVDYLVATDAIGMGLNMDVNHVGFAGLSKFDGARPRRLSAAEVAQIAGRAGRGMRDGTFGTTWRSSHGATARSTCPGRTRCSTACCFRRRCAGWPPATRRPTCRRCRRWRSIRRSGRSPRAARRPGCCGRRARSRTSASWATTATRAYARACSSTSCVAAGCRRPGWSNC